MKEVYNPKDRSCVLPVSCWREKQDETICKIRELGITIKKIKMPVDINILFYKGKLPKWLIPVENDEPFSVSGMQDFQDEKGRPRLRICMNAMWLNTVVWTRYTTDHAYKGSKGWVASVRDMEIENEDDLDGVDTIWQGKKRGLLDECKEEAEAWLDKKYPDWRNPMAYWSK
jgi:hypothetical protein